MSILTPNTLGGISTFNRYEALNQVCTDLRPLPVDSDNFDDGDYRSDSISHGESSVPVNDIPDIAVPTERKSTCGKGGTFFQHNTHMESSDSEPEGCENKVKVKTQPNRNTFWKTSEDKIPQRRKTKFNSTKEKATRRKTSQVEVTDHFPSLPSRNNNLTNHNLKFYAKSQPTIPKTMMGNRVSSTTPSQSQTPFTVISNKKSARADNITLSDPLRKVVKVMRKLIWEQVILDDIRKENPALNIKSVTTWNNNFLDIGLHEITEVDSISIQNNVYPLFPYIISPIKCGYCQKWGHPTNQKKANIFAETFRNNSSTNNFEKIFKKKNLTWKKIKFPWTPNTLTRNLALMYRSLNRNLSRVSKIVRTRLPALIILPICSLSTCLTVPLIYS